VTARRIYGLETEYGITCALRGQRRLTPDEVARYLFRKVVTWGRSSNVFLENGGRLYLDVGSHPEYATPECDSIGSVILHDRAGEHLLNDLVASAESRLREEGIRGSIHLFRNNTDSAGNSYGCHENYLIARTERPFRMDDALIPFLVTRQIYAGAGKLVMGPRGASYVLSQRADHIWEGVSSATTRSRPIINTRDEPHADPDSWRRLHVIVGDTNMSEHATYLKVGATACLLRMMEAGWPLGDMSLENPIRAIREISQDLTCRRPVRLLSGKELSALEVQRHFLEAALAYRDAEGFPADEEAALVMWQRAIDGLEGDPDALSGEIDWIIKHRMLEAYKARHGVGWSDPRLQMIDLQYHDIDQRRGLFHRAEALGHAVRLTDDVEVAEAVATPPQTTRARLRGEFVRRAKERRRDFTVDWVHLKINDQTQRTVLCKDPFRCRDERVDRLIESL
jgi:proteasome accessory factor A